MSANKSVIRDLTKVIMNEIDRCALPSCGSALRSAGGPLKGQKRGTRLVHDGCAAQYDEELTSRERRLQGPPGGYYVTTLPEVRDTEGYFNWVQGYCADGSTDYNEVATAYRRGWISGRSR